MTTYSWHKIKEVETGPTFREHILDNEIRLLCTEKNEIMTDWGFKQLGNLRYTQRVLIGQDDYMDAYSTHTPHGIYVA